MEASVVWAADTWEGMGDETAGTFFAAQFTLTLDSDGVLVTEKPSGNAGLSDIASDNLDVLDMTSDDSVIYSEYFLDEVNSVVVATDSDEVYITSGEERETILEIL